MNTHKLFETIHQQILGIDLIKQANQYDTNANGVQIWGAETIHKIALGVSCNDEFLQKAGKWGADVCIFHHGLDLNSHGLINSIATPSLQRQLKRVIEHNITIAGYHYTLDAHPELGNNAQIINLLGAHLTGEPYFESWGYVGEFDTPISTPALAKACSNLFHHDVFMVLGGPEEIKRIGVCSGGAKPHPQEILEIHDKHIDAIISGEIIESNVAVAKESGFTYFACGHYATEVFGVKALGEKIKALFPALEVEFIDVWNNL